MKALSRNRLTPVQRSSINKYVMREYEKIKTAHEDLIVKRLLFFCLLAISKTAQEQLGFGETRRRRFVSEFIENVNDISKTCADNKCEYQNGRIDFDIDYNRELLSRMAKQYGVEFDESVFDDTFEL